MNHPQQSWNDSEALVESYLTLVTTNNPKGSPKPGAETSALHDAVLQGDIQFLEGLIRSGVDVNAEVEGFTALHFAAKNGHHAAVKVLLDASADVYRHTAGQTPCHVAAKHGHHTIVSTFLDRGFSMHNRAGHPHASLVEAAAANGQLEMVTLLTMTGADINADVDTNALLVAAEGGHADVVSFLIHARADVGRFGVEAVRRASKCETPFRRQQVLLLLFENMNVTHGGPKGLAVSQRPGGVAETRARQQHLKEEVFSDGTNASGADTAKVIFETSSPLSLLKKLEHHGAALPEFTKHNKKKFLPKVGAASARKGGKKVHDWRKTDREMEQFLKEAQLGM